MISRRSFIKRTPLPRSRKPIAKRKRSTSEFKRIYGSKARVEWVKSLPCAACGVVGYSENAHVAPPGEKGTGYKAGFEWITALCRTRLQTWGGVTATLIGCHTLYDEYPSDFAARFPEFDAERAAADCEAAWQSHLKGATRNEQN